MRAGVAVLLALAATAAAAILTGVAAAVFVGLGLILAGAAVASSAFRASPGWWGIPGMRRASRSAAAFAGLILLYTVPVPVAAFAIAHTLRAPAPPTASVSGTPERTPNATPTATAEPIFSPPPAEISGPASPSASASTATPTNTPSSRPPSTPTPANLCGAPANPWNYNFCRGQFITNPPARFCAYFNCITDPMQGKGYVVECHDGGYNLSGGKPNACSAHGGVRNILFS